MTANVVRRIICHRAIKNATPMRSREAARAMANVSANARSQSLKGKRISCPPHELRRLSRPVDVLHQIAAHFHHDYEHGFPLTRSLRASAQRSTSVLFSFVLPLLIMAASFDVWQSKTILA
jgi:hypothetical protein